MTTQRAAIHGMKRMFWLPVTAFAAISLTACGANALPEATGGSGFATVSYLGGSADPTALRTAIDACNAANKESFAIDYQPAADISDAGRQLTRRLSAKDSTIDLFSFEGSQTAEFADAGWLRPLGGSVKSDVVSSTVRGPLTTVTYDKRVWAAPLAADVQGLWFRKDLSPTAPTTWSELVQQSTQLAAQKRAHSLVVSPTGKHSVFTLFDSFVQSSGGSILSDDGVDVRIDDRATVAATTLQALAADGVAGAAVVSNSVVSARHEFTTGNAAFLFDSALAASNLQADATTPRLRDNMAWTTTPAQTAGAATRSPMRALNVGVGAYAKHQRQAFKAVACLRDMQQQRTLAQAGDTAPVLRAAFDDEDVRSAMPNAAAIRDSLENGAVLPQTRVLDDVATSAEGVLVPLRTLETARVSDALRAAITTTLDDKGVR